MLRKSNLCFHTLPDGLVLGSDMCGNRAEEQAFAHEGSMNADVHLHHSLHFCTCGGEPGSLENKKEKKKTRGDLIEKDLFIKKP